MNFLSVERFLVNQEPITDTSGFMFQVGDIVSSRTTINWKVVAFAVHPIVGISCLLEYPSTHTFRGDEPWKGDGWQHGKNEQGDYVIRRVMKYSSLYLTEKGVSA